MAIRLMPFQTPDRVAPLMDRAFALHRLVEAVRALAAEHRAHLDKRKANHTDLARPAFVWHYLLQSFSTMGRAAGWHGLIGNQENCRRVTYDVAWALADHEEAEGVGYYPNCYPNASQRDAILRYYSQLLATRHFFDRLTSSNSGFTGYGALAPFGKVGS